MDTTTNTFTVVTDTPEGFDGQPTNTPDGTTLAVYNVDVLGVNANGTTYTDEITVATTTNWAGEIDAERHVLGLHPERHDRIRVAKVIDTTIYQSRIGTWHELD